MTTRTSTATRDTLASAFDLPDRFQGDEFLRDLYDEIVTNLRAEARGIPMNTVQTLLLERISYYYVSLKEAERSGQISPSQMKDLTKFWLDMTTEFNRQLAAGHEKLREALLSQISEMVMERIMEIPDREIKTTLVLSLKEGFAEMGL